MEYLRSRENYLLSYHAHYTHVKDAMGSERGEASNLSQRVEHIIQREEQDIQRVEKFVRGLLDDDLAFCICMDIYFQTISENHLFDNCFLWDDHSALLRRSNSQFSKDLERFYFQSDSAVARNYPQFQRAANTLNVIKRFPLVRYVPASDVDSESSIDDSSTDVYGDNDGRGKVVGGETWERSDLPDIYLESHRAACGFCLVDFEEPRRRVSPGSMGSAPHDPVTEDRELDHETQEREQPEPLIELPCSHVFHRSCIYHSVFRSDNPLECPICRRGVSLSQSRPLARILLSDVASSVSESNNNSPYTPGPGQVGGRVPDRVEHTSARRRDAASILDWLRKLGRRIRSALHLGAGDRVR